MTDRRPVKRMRAVLDSRTGLGISWLDVKLGVRMLGKEPLLTAVAILTLATGIPTSLTPAHMLSIFDSTFPVDEGDRIVGIRNWDTEDNRATVRSLHDFDIWRNELSSFDQVAAARSDPWNVHSPDGKAEEVRGAEVSASTFAMLRVPPLLGQYLIDADESIDAPRVVVIGEGIWASRFGRDPDIIGKQIGIGRTPHTVVGVMPEGFLFPMRDYLWLPLRANPVDYKVGAGPDIFVFGRLADGVTVTEANAELGIIGVVSPPNGLTLTPDSDPRSSGLPSLRSASPPPGCPRAVRSSWFKRLPCCCLRRFAGAWGTTSGSSVRWRSACSLRPLF